MLHIDKEGSPMFSSPIEEKRCESAPLETGLEWCHVKTVIRKPSLVGLNLRLRIFHIACITCCKFLKKKSCDKVYPLFSFNNLRNGVNLLGKAF